MKQNKSSRSTVLLFFLGAAMIVAALIMLVPDLLNYKQSNDTYEALKDTYVSEKPENTEVAEELDTMGFTSAKNPFKTGSPTLSPAS
jgi:sortase B